MNIGLFTSNIGDLPLCWAASVLKEADEHNANLVFFDAGGLDRVSRTVLGNGFADGEWQRRRVPLPPAVIDMVSPDPSGEASSDQEWLNEHTLLIAGRMSADYERICQHLRQSDALRTLADDPVPAGDSDLPRQDASSSSSGALRFRVPAVPAGHGGWTTGRISLVAEESASLPEKQSVDPFRQQEFSDRYPFMEAHLRHMAVETAAIVESLHVSRLPAVTVELSVDHRNHTRFRGATVGNDERAGLSAALAYAVHFAKSGRSGGRLVRNRSSFQYTIGMLVGWALSKSFLEMCHHVAVSHGAKFFYFYPKWVDAGQRQMTGAYWDDGVWCHASFGFPDVIYDRMRRRGEKFASLYEALSSVPITHTVPFGTFNKVRTYRTIVSDLKLSSAVIPFALLKRARRAQHFVDRHSNLIFKPVKGWHGKDIITATHKDGQYEVFDQQSKHIVGRGEFDEMLETLGKQNYFVQKFVESKTKEGYPFHVRVHMMKDGLGQWKSVFTFPSFSLTPHMKITNHENTFRGVTKWEWFLEHQFGEKPGGRTDRRLKEFAHRAAALLQRRLGDGFHEVGIDVGMDENGAIKLFEANMGNVGMNFHEFEVAKHSIEYALFLAAGKGVEQN